MPARRPGPIKLWVAAERLPQLLAVFPDASLEPMITAPVSSAETIWSREDALVELVRGRLEGLGPVTARHLAVSAGILLTDVDATLLKLEAEGFVLRGRFTPGIEETMVRRRLLARIHSYTLNRLSRRLTGFECRRHAFVCRGRRLSRSADEGPRVCWPHRTA